MLDRKSKKSTMLIVFFAILLVVVFVLLINYFQSTKIILQDETNQHLKDNAKQVNILRWRSHPIS